MTTEQGNDALRKLCQEMVDRLLTLRSQFEHGDTYYVQRGDFADRAAQFAGYVDAALLLADHARFAQAFALLRSALEQWAADAILMLGERFVRLDPNTPTERYEEILLKWKDGKAPWIVEEPVLTGKSGSTLRTVVRGLTNDKDGWVLHPIYFEADFYDPFYGPPDMQEDFADWGLEGRKTMPSSREGDTTASSGGEQFWKAWSSTEWSRKGTSSTSRSTTDS